MSLRFTAITRMIPTVCATIGNLWICTDGGGLNRFVPETQDFIHYTSEPGNPRSLLVPALLSLYEDRSGALWITTQSGISKWDRYAQKFEIVQYNPNNPHSISSNKIRGMIEDRQGNVWVATADNGFSRFDPATGQFTHYPPNPDAPNGLRHANVYALYEDREGILWLGSWGGGLSRFDPAAGRFTHYAHDPEDPRSVGHNIITSFAEDTGGALWMSTYNGLDRFDRTTETFTHYRFAEEQLNNSNDNRILTIHLDRSGMVWIGTLNSGLAQFDPATEKFIRHYRHDARDPHSLSHNSVPIIHEDAEGTLWIATVEGLNKLDRTTGTFRHYTEQDGLPNNYISNLLEDAQGHLWLGQERNLTRFDPHTESFRTYKAGAEGMTFFSPARLRRRNGELWFGGNAGFIRFFPERVTDNPSLPPVVLTDFRLFHEPVPIGGDSPLQQHINAAEEIRLRYDQSVFTLTFAALSYTAPEHNQYAYLMEGVDRDWVTVGSQHRFATYTKLPPGRYTFRVKASNNDGQWNHQGAAIAITVLPPWWQTWWFRILIAVLLVSAIAGGYTWRVQSLKARSRQLEQQVSERTRELRISKEKADIANHAKSRFLANMSHELRTPLNGILGYAQILKREPALTPRQQDGLNMIEHSGNHLVMLINDILDLAKVESGTIELYEIDFHLLPLLNSIKDLLRVRAERKGIIFETIFDDTLPTRVHGDERRLRQVLLNLLGNAVKFTESGGTVSFRVSEKSDLSNPSSIRFEITDTGAGISPEHLDTIFEPFRQSGNAAQQAKGTGLGLAISRNLVELMGGVIQVRSQPGSGSAFWFELSLSEVAGQAEPSPPAPTTDRGDQRHAAHDSGGG